MSAYLLVLLFLVSALALANAAQFRKASKASASSLLLGLDSESLTANQKIALYSKVAEAKAREASWYEKSVSLIGTVSFISMLIAAGVQTVRLSTEEDKVKHLEARLVDLRQHEERLERVLRSTSKRLIADYRGHRVLGDDDLYILRWYLESLQEKRGLTVASDTEPLQVALALSDTRNVVDLLRSELSLIDKLPALDQASVAQHFYIAGKVPEALQIVNGLDPGELARSSDLHERVIVIRASSKEIYHNEVLELARLRGLGRVQAQQRLEAKVSILRDAASHFRGAG